MKLSQIISNNFEQIKQNNFSRLRDNLQQEDWVIKEQDLVEIQKLFRGESEHHILSFELTRTLEKMNWFVIEEAYKKFEKEAYRQEHGLSGCEDHYFGFRDYIMRIAYGKNHEDGESVGFSLSRVCASFLIKEAYKISQEFKQ